MSLYFNTDERQTSLRKFKNKLVTLNVSSEFEKKRNNFIQLIINSMILKPDEWDKSCEININWIGDKFLDHISREDKDTNEWLDYICSICFRFLFEFYLSRKSGLSMEFEDAKSFIFENIGSFSSGAKAQIEYAIRMMPIAIVKQIANSESIESIKDYNSMSSKVIELKEQWEQELSAKEDRVNKLKESLSKYENAFNFVGLFQGFDDLGSAKLKESKILLFWLIVLSVLIILPVVGELVIIYKHIDNIAAIKDGMIVSIFPTLSIVAIALYYFRVLLFNYKSVKSQLLQIELRKTLCRFIQHYSEYSSKIKGQDAESLAKFENIIFSSIVPNESSLPSTYDGLEQISKLISAAK